HQSDYQRVAVGNALLAVVSFLKAHDMATMRTPEVQFLGHVTDGILNANRFSLHAGYRPVAAFDGLTIYSALDGTPVFDNGTQSGFIGVGDAVALLQWLSRYLRGDQGYVSGGDAG
ncbi:MAG TPA: hypothetical protein VL381_00070, partial [Rhodocyclaceae bacterium]|nr:hypothetical protein [Rhodocyclaceae bacterium]